MISSCQCERAKSWGQKDHLESITWISFRSIKFLLFFIGNSEITKSEKALSLRIPHLSKGMWVFTSHPRMPLVCASFQTSRRPRTSPTNASDRTLSCAAQVSGSCRSNSKYDSKTVFFNVLCFFKLNLCLQF